MGSSSVCAIPPGCTKTQTEPTGTCHHRVVTDLLSAVEDIVVEVAQTIVVPRWRSLEAGDVEEKSPGDLVTVADVEAEHALSRRLADLLPGSAVVGEEAAAADPSVLDRIGESDDIWIIDPVDGTGNFADGDPDFGIMVAQVSAGEIVRAWIHLPIHETTFVAERGAGTARNGTALRLGGVEIDASRLTGAVKTRFLPDDVRTAVTAGLERVAPLDPSTICSAVEYGRIATGDLDYLLYWRTLPWDHAPGALVVAEAGGVARRLEGDSYRVGDSRDGLLVAHSDDAWHQLRGSLLAGI